MDSNNTTSTTSIGDTTTASSTTESISASPASTPVLITSPEKLCRVGSGTSSIVLDSENGIEAESRKLPSSQYKGVVPQPNGRWGAQIYEKHQRVWLGTFNEEEEAAKAYDIAAQRFRGRDAITNFKPSPGDVLILEDDIEAVFLNSRSKAEIVDMLRKHTYNDELEHSKRNYNFDATKNNNREGGFMFMGLSTVGGTGSAGVDRTAAKARGHLFEKAVTPSDVGKLNRLVIPKQHAEKHFPLQIGTISKGLLLNFEDNEGKVWRFRYSYWNSSQSYVLTKGWSRFVKEKCLKAGDVVSFQRSTGADKQLYIDWKPRNGMSTTSVQKPGNPIIMNPVQPVAVRLFGVDIFIKMPTPPITTTTTTTTGSSNGINSKRLRDLDFSAVDQYSYCNSKKQRIVVGAL